MPFIIMKKYFSIFVFSAIFAVFSSCTSDDLVEPLSTSNESSDIVSKTSYPCTNGFEMLDGEYYNIGGSGPIALGARASSFSGVVPGYNSVQSLTSGKLYRKSVSVGDIGLHYGFKVINTGSNDVMVRVVGKTSTNQLLLVSAKRLYASNDGYVDIRSCDLSHISNYTHIYFEIYAYGNTTVYWALG